MLASDKHDIKAHLYILFLRKFIAQKVYTACTETSYKIVLLNNLNKYAHWL
jgi:hypothetical protein